MTWRDVIVRYKQTFLGVAWAILRPFLSMVVFTIFFGNLAQVPSDGIPYPIFSYTALLPWELFSKALSDASRSLVQNSNMITKIYFPRMILPLASVIWPGWWILPLRFVVLIGMMMYYHIAPTSNTIYLPLFILLALITSFGTGLWLSAANVAYRDVNYVLPISNPDVDVHYPHRLLLQHGTGSMAGDLFAQSDGWSGQWLPLGTAGNRTAGADLVDLGRRGNHPMLISGLFYFKKMERQFADLV